MRQAPFWPFLALSGNIRPKFGRGFVRPITLHGPFCVMQPIFRPAGNTAVLSLQPIGTKITFVFLIEVLPNRWKLSNGSTFRSMQSPKNIFFSFYNILFYWFLNIKNIFFLDFQLLNQGQYYLCLMANIQQAFLPTLLIVDKVVHMYCTSKQIDVL